MSESTILVIRAPKTLQDRLTRLSATVGLHKSTLARSILTQFCDGQLMPVVPASPKAEQKNAVQVKAN
jgi:antitoxin component of RelBE/YafQ-DinJ toxin-antitoxin module